MFTADLASFKIREKELHQQAACFRLARSLDRSQLVTARLAAGAGRILISTGERLINRGQK